MRLKSTEAKLERLRSGQASQGPLFTPPATEVSFGSIVSSCTHLPRLANGQVDAEAFTREVRQLSSRERTELLKIICQGALHASVADTI
jgi:hypothetical protein